MIIGIDLGQKTTGIAISETQLATPYRTISHKNSSEALKKIINICAELGADVLVIGFVEGKIKSMFEEFASKLQTARPNLKVVLWDETLTSRQATQSMVKLGIARQRRAKKEHEVAAALILQSYLDEND